MKWILSISIVLSLSLNIYLIYEEVQHSYNEEAAQSVNRSLGLGRSKTKWSEGSKIFQAKLKEGHKFTSRKKYYYINIWANWCAPCIKEMPWLDSIAGTLSKDVGYVFVSHMSDSIANTCLKRKNYQLHNFVLLNDMNDFISSICNEQQIKGLVYPMILILSDKGEVLHYSTGAYSNKREAAGFAELINKVCK